MLKRILKGARLINFPFTAILGIVSGGEPYFSEKYEMIIIRAYIFSITARVLLLAFSLLITPAAFAADMTDHQAVINDGSKNIIVIVADDMGHDVLAYSNEHNLSPSTPKLDQLAAEGVFFRNAWSNPICAPARAALLTGKHGYKTKVLYPGGDTDALADEEKTFADQLSGTYETAAFGKWGVGVSIFNQELPFDHGFNHYEGVTSDTLDPTETGEDYSNYTKMSYVEGELTIAAHTVYATRDVAMDTANWIDDHVDSAGGKPFLAYVAFNAPHNPFHIPPLLGLGDDETYDESRWDLRDMQSGESHPDDGKNSSCGPTQHYSGYENRQLCYRAAVEAMDYWIGQLFERMKSAGTSNIDVYKDTLIIFIGDNGTPNTVIVEETDATPFIDGHGKGGMFEGGVNVPFIISGGEGIGIDVPVGGEEIADKVYGLDIFATVLAMADVTSSQTDLDSRNLLAYLDPSPNPVGRGKVYSETYRVEFGNNNVDKWTVSDGTTKYIRSYEYDGENDELVEDFEACFDLSADIGETVDLWAAGSGSIYDICFGFKQNDRPCEANNACGENWYLVDSEDNDGDSTPNASDSFPLNRSEDTDADADTIGANTDFDDNDATEWVDCDNDGVGDNSDGDTSTCQHDSKNDWFINTSHRSSEIFEPSPSSQGVLTDIQTVTVDGNDAGEVIVLETGSIPNYGDITVTLEMMDDLAAYPATDWQNDTAPTISENDTVILGEDIGFDTDPTSVNCLNTGDNGGGGDGFWPPGGDCPIYLDHAIALDMPAVAQPNPGSCKATGGAIGWFVNGLAVFGYWDARVDNNIWRRNAPVFERYGVDVCNSHSPANGQYHTHFNPRCLGTQLGDVGTGHSPVYGYAQDGYAIHGPWQADGVLAKSSWVKRDYGDYDSSCADGHSGGECSGYGYGCSDGQRSCVMEDQMDPGQGTTKALTAGYDLDEEHLILPSYRNKTITLTSGAYLQDYYWDESLSGPSRMDKHNGHSHGKYGYHYHVTVEEELRREGQADEYTAQGPSFPYIVGPTYYGESRHCTILR
jgi:arylsulfatase A-like enzyme